MLYFYLAKPVIKYSRKKNLVWLSFVLGFILFFNPAYAKNNSPQTFTGIISYVHADLEGSSTANGEKYRNNKFTAAHRKLPMGTVVLVTRTSNKRQTILRINDRGPYTKGRVLDISLAGAKKLNMLRSGITKAKVEIISDRRGYSLDKNKNFYIKLKALDKNEKKELDQLRAKLKNKSLEIFEASSGKKKYFIGFGPFKRFRELEKVLYKIPESEKIDILLQ